MIRRKDAGVAMVRLATRIHDRFPEIAGPRTVWTIGRIGLEPNAPSVIPGRAEIQLQFRDPDLAWLDACETTLRALVAEADHTGPCRVEVEPLPCSQPRPMDPRFQQLIEGAAEDRAPGLHMRMPRPRVMTPRYCRMHAGGDDVYPKLPRRQPSLVRGYQRGRYRPWRPGVRRRRLPHPQFSDLS